MENKDFHIEISYLLSFQNRFPHDFKRFCQIFDTCLRQTGVMGEDTPPVDAEFISRSLDHGMFGAVCFSGAEYLPKLFMWGTVLVEDTEVIMDVEYLVSYEEEPLDIDQLFSSAEGQTQYQTRDATRFRVMVGLLYNFVENHYVTFSFHSDTQPVTRKICIRFALSNGLSKKYPLVPV